MSSSIKKHFLVSISGSIVIKVIGLALTFVANVFFARVLGSAGYGTLALVLAWVNILSVVVLFGGNFLLIREVAALNAQRSWARLRALIRWTDAQVIALSSIVIAVVYCVTRYLLDWAPERLNFLLLASPLLFLRAFLINREAMLRGFKRILKAQIPDAIVRPAILIVAGVSAYLYMDRQLSVEQAVYVHVATFTLVVFLAFIWSYRTVPQEVRAEAPDYAIRYWTAAAVPLLAIALLKILEAQLAIVVLGHLSTPESVGQFAVAKRGAELVNIAFMAVNVTIGPTIADFHARKRLHEIRDVGTRSARLAMAIAAPLIIGLFFFGEMFLAIFGQEFVVANPVLRVLLVGQVINVATGSVAMWLTMTNRAGLAMVGLAIAEVIDLTLCLLLIPGLDAYGAAIASVCAMTVSKILMVAMVWKVYRIDTTVFGLGLRGERRE